jgi:protein subunit release factor B
MIHFPVSEEKNRWLEERMEALGIREKDIEEKFIRSSGRGGQKVNKTSTCVYLRHLLTGIEVKCMKERVRPSTGLARRELVERLQNVRKNDNNANRREKQKARRERAKQNIGSLKVEAGGEKAWEMR